MTLKVDLDKALERRFRELSMKKFGYSKGAIKKGAEAAIRRWTEEAVTDIPEGKVRDPIKLIEGGLSHLKGKYTSVELQHEAMNLWPEKKK